ncbi:MAG: polyamine aminopropyltransferase [Bacteroidia bacterium]|nr:polyamine aminopropyltransferase [Bacteroidia bacterium]
MRYLLLISVFVIATCGLIYELVAGTLASYILGDSVTQFSTIIGAYLFSMGIGSFLSKYFQRNLITVFVRIELLIALVGGFGAAFLFWAFQWVTSFQLLLYFQVGLTGIMVGLEIPLLMRILQDKFEFKDLVSQIFTFDYIGALFASLLFPLLLIPYLGLIRTSFFFGMLNAGVALWAVFMFKEEIRGRKAILSANVMVLLALVAGFAFSGNIQKNSENQAYEGNVIYAKSTPYQRIVLARVKSGLRLFLNGNLQFNSLDEYRYHEALVHPILAAVENPRKVLVLGGGDGLAVREILKYPTVDSILLVDLDPAMTRLFTTNPLLTALNDSSFYSPKVRVINGDAFQWIRRDSSLFDCVIIDFPDPSNYSLGKLYSLSFYHELKRILKPEGFGVIQSTSPYVARKSFWCVKHTLEAAGFVCSPYHTYLPSFGDWGFLAVGNRILPVSENYPANTRFISGNTLEQMMHFPLDIEEVETDINRLNNQALVQYFEKEWAVFTP